MMRKEVYKEIEGMFGLVPSMFKAVPDSELDLEWKLFKRVQMEEGPIPNKYRELIGVAIAATTKCRYCTYYHTELAKLNGATDAEIEDALHFAKSSAGWSTYVNGLQLDYDEFKQEIDQACEFVRAKQTRKHLKRAA
jgi:AhpD family alkylhydroperoxidase